MKKANLENINSELFNSFNPSDELWIAGGAAAKGTGSVTGSGTFGPNGPDGTVDGDLDFGLTEETRDIPA